MSIRVKTKNPVYTAITGGKYKVYREMESLNIDPKTGLFTANVIDVAFKDDVIDILDAELKPTGEKESIIIKSYVIREKTHTIEPEKVNFIFTTVGESIDATKDKFHEKFMELLGFALLLDTRNSDLLDTTPEEWEVYK